MCARPEPGPATNIKAIATSTSLAVSWTAPTGQKITAYSVALKDQKHWKVWKHGLHKTSKTFYNLQPGTSYTFFVIPMIGDTHGDQAKETFNTSK